MGFNDDRSAGKVVTSPTPWYRELSRYHWLVLLVAALGWMFDTMDQQLFNLARVPAIADLRQAAASGSLCRHESQSGRVRRLRDHHLHARLGYRRDRIRDLGGPNRPRADDGPHDPCLLAFHWPERVLHLHLGFLRLSVLDRSGGRRRVRRRRRLGRGGDAGQGSPPCIGLAASVVSGGKHDRGAYQPGPWGARANRNDFARLALHVSSRRTAGATRRGRYVPLEGARTMAGHGRACGARTKARINRRIVWNCALAPPCACRHAPGVRRRRRPLGNRFFQFRSHALRVSKASRERGARARWGGTRQSICAPGDRAAVRAG